MIRVDAERLRADFDALSAIGRTQDGGVSRTTFSPAHFEARAWFRERAIEAGLDVRTDAAANHSAVLPARGAARTLLLGSHLDTVPVGGRYDGALGVIAALEVLRTVKDAGIEPPVSLEAIDFTDEEGSLVGLLGSWALAGTLRPEILAKPRGGRTAFTEGLRSAGLDEHRLGEAWRDPRSLAGYIELHIEQGPVLEREQIDVGVVSAIAGSRSYRLTFSGVRRHAGTTPMDARKDALLAAGAFAVAVQQTVMSDFPGCVGTVGNIEVERPAFNVVPGRAVASIELRAPEDETLEQFELAVLDAGRRCASIEVLELRIDEVGRWDAVQLDPSMQGLVADAAHELGLRTMPLVSGAGHDAQALAPVTPTAMIFVPSLGGISHDPAERTDWDDCVNGANVLLGVALSIAGRESARGGHGDGRG